MLPMTKGMFPIHIPEPMYRRICLHNNVKETEMEYGFYRNGVFYLHLYDYTGGFYEPREGATAVRVYDYTGGLYEPREGATVVRVTDRIPVHDWYDQYTLVLEISSKFFSVENKTTDDLCGLPCFKYGRVIYETETVRKTWNVKEPVFPYTIGSKGNLAIPLDLSRREIFENGKMVL